MWNPAVSSLLPFRPLADTRLGAASIREHKLLLSYVVRIVHDRAMAGRIFFLFVPFTA